LGNSTNEPKIILRSDSMLVPSRIGMCITFAFKRKNLIKSSTHTDWELLSRSWEKIQSGRAGTIFCSSIWSLPSLVSWEKHFLDSSSHASKGKVYRVFLERKWCVQWTTLTVPSPIQQVLAPLRIICFRRRKKLTVVIFPYFIKNWMGIDQFRYTRKMTPHCSHHSKRKLLFWVATREF